jgi:hypothetical protein
MGFHASLKKLQLLQILSISSFLPVVQAENIPDIEIKIITNLRIFILIYKIILDIYLIK